MATEKNAIVVKSNKLMEASYRLDLIEQRIILYAIVEARATQSGLGTGFVTVDAKGFATMFRMRPDNVYSQLKEAMDTLFGRYIIIHDTHPESGERRVSKVRWVSTASYIDGAGTVQLRFSTDLLPYITRLESEFTTYRLEKIGAMTSAHAVRIYELLAQHLGIGKREIEISWLKDLLCITDEYKAIKDFKKRVIDVAVLQINEHTDLKVSYTQRKTGVSVTHLIFSIKTEVSPPKARTNFKITDADITKQARPGESWEVARARLMASVKPDGGREGI